MLYGILLLDTHGNMFTDAEKMNSAQLLGWNVLAYTSLDLQRRPVQVVEEIEAFLSAKMQ